MAEILKIDMDHPNIYQAKVWGNTGELERLTGKILSNLENKVKKPIGEIFLASSHKDGTSKVSWSEDYNTLDKILNSDKAMEVFGPRTWAEEKFPFLVKYISAKDKLSLQNHSKNKIEAWVTLSEGKMLYGLTEMGQSAFNALSQEAIAEKILTKDLSEDAMSQYFNIKKFSPGETYLVQPGIVHALLEGTIFEVGTNSNFTNRGCDWGRNEPDRPLHIDDFMKALYLHQVPTEPIQSLVRYQKNAGAKTLMAADHFAVDQIEFEEPSIHTFKTDGKKFYLLTAVDGNFDVTDSSGSSYNLKKGDNAIVQAKKDEYTIKGEGKLFMTYYPNIEEDIIVPLRKAGHSDDTIKQLGGPIYAFNDVYVQMKEMDS